MSVNFDTSNIVVTWFDCSLFRDIPKQSEKNGHCRIYKNIYAVSEKMDHIEKIYINTF